MKALKIDHLGIAVKSIEEARRFFHDVLGLTLQANEVVEKQGVRTEFLELGQSTLELMEPITPDNPVSRHLAKFGPGIQHLAIEVDDLDAACNELREKGVWVINQEPAAGARSKKVIFVHPVSASGVIVELVQDRD